MPVTGGALEAEWVVLKGPSGSRPKGFKEVMVRGRGRGCLASPGRVAELGQSGGGTGMLGER